MPVLMLPAWPPTAATKTASVGFNATLVAACAAGTTSNGVVSFGTLNFGTISSLAVPVDAVTSQGSGSIVLRCTPGASVTLALGNGNNASGSVSAGRWMINAATGETLAYQLYQNAARTTVWGNGSNGGTTLVLSANGAVQEYKIYARVLTAATMPSTGNYSDSVLVTVTY